MDADEGGMITVTGRKIEEDIYISIEDNGMGMREEVVENILTDNSKVPKHGSGVGVINEMCIRDRSLTAPEVEKLFKMMRQLKEQGISLIYISHKMDEIFEICDQVSVLRDGRCV